MSQLTENKQYPIEEILEKLRYQAQILPPSPTSARYLRALESLQSSVYGARASQPAAPQCPTTKTARKPEDSSLKPEDSSLKTQASRLKTQDSSLKTQDSSLKTQDSRLKTQLTDWLVNQWLIGQPFTTASLYLDILSALYGAAVKEGQLPSTDIFSQLKADLKALGPDGWRKGIDDEIFARALRLTKNASLLIADDAIAAALVLWSLTHALQPLDEIAMLKKADLNDHEDLKELKVVNDLILGSNNRKRYAFNLRQSERTPKQLSTHIARIVNALFKRARLPQATDPFQTVEALWAYAALRSGIPASTIVSYLGHAPLGLPILKLCKSSVFSLQSSDCGQAADNTDCVASEDLRLKTEDLAAIGRVFLENEPRWYAMSLRPGVRFTQICRRIQVLGDRLPDIQLFYPCEEIARAIGKKIVIKERPFIHSVVFFRAKLTDIGRLFAKIGDLAWCYRQSARPGAPYADISQKQFERFQQTIAQFTPDYEVASTGELELKKNDRVQILGGLFGGQEAIVEGTLSPRPVPSNGLSSGAAGLSQGEQISEDSRLKTQDSSIIYRLNIIGDNGIEWRINVDPRLLTKSN